MQETNACQQELGKHTFMQRLQHPHAVQAALGSIMENLKSEKGEVPHANI
jgi:hypothetical protein